eukprot:scaffold268938_cov22-Tisochrysis_lutea.AAC.1
MGAMGSSMAMGNMGMAGPQMGSGMGMGGNMMGGGNMGMQQQVGMMSPGGGMAGMQGGPMMNAQWYGWDAGVAVMQVHICIITVISSLLLSSLYNIIRHSDIMVIPPLYCKTIVTRAAVQGVQMHG